MQISWLKEVLEAAGVRVVEEGDWRNRSAGSGFEPVGVLWHHTAVSSSAGRPAPGLGVVIDGRSDLPGPLCHALVDFFGVFHLVSANRANHAGRSRGSGPIPVGDGNTLMVGWEIDYAGDGSGSGGPVQRMSPAQYDASVRATAAVLRRLGRSADHARGHRETSLDGKIDPSFIDLDAMRRDVAAAMQQGPAPVAPMPYESGRVVAARSSDGRLEAFAAGADGVWHAWQTRVNGEWSNWENHGGPRNAELAIAPNRDGRLEVFALNGEVLQHAWQTAPSAGFSGWATFGTGGHDLAAGANADGRLEVFASNPSGVFHRWQTGTAWSEWEGSAPGDNGPANARLEMAMSPDGRLEVFALSAERFGHLFQTAASGRWGAWEAFGTGGHDLTVDANADGRLEVAASNPNGVFRKWQTGRDTWSEWRGTGGLPNAQLASERTPDGRIELLAINASAAQHAYQLGTNGEFSAWEGFGTGGTEINASKNADGRIDVFATSPSGVFHKWQTGPNTWSAWEWLGGNAGPGLA